MDEYNREPCPWRIVDDTGGAFAMGAIGGSVFQAIKGFRNAPSGFKRRLNGSLTSVATRAPLLGGSFAAWGGMFSVVDCSLIHLRQKEDPWNSIISGATAGGILAMRSGKTAMITSAVVGGVLLAFIEGMGLMIQRFSAQQMYQPPPTDEKDANIKPGFFA